MKEQAPRRHAEASFSSMGAPASKILIVDDEPYICEILSRWLEDEGYNCHVAYNAEEAMEKVETNGFSLLMCDIRMPGKSGLELLTMLKERFPDLAVLMVTGVDDRKTAIRALTLGAYGYLLKPFEQNEVIINAVNALERRRLTMGMREYEHRLEQKVREQTEDIRRSREEISLRLTAAQEYRHDETGAHIRRMGLFSETIARRMGRSKEYAEMLRTAAPMHDVGKIGIADLVLLKPDKLTEQEFEVMKTHTTIGASILEGTTIPLLNVARDVALSHHEWWDGSGYPQGISGEGIPETARIVAVLDVYDALVNDRVYRPAMSEEQALAIMSEEAGGRRTHFDPKVFKVFMGTLPELRSIRGGIKQ